jgi:nitrite reductase/ring-hydroxylating ferredoxin subunit
MNNYGLVLNEIGMRPVFDALLEDVFQPLGAILMGDEEHRLDKLGGTETCAENWGGSSLDDHHSFIVQYRPEDDKHLDMHIDECDVTWNFGITPTENFEGNDLTFCGMMDTNEHRLKSHSYKHQKGRCVVHSGKRRHGALDIEKGERASLIMWSKSTSFRRTAEYRRRNSTFVRNGPADRVCLSYTHDRDYKDLMPRKFQYHMKPDADTDEASVGSASTKAVQTEKKWVRICGNDELNEGKAKMIYFEAENEQVAVFRHHGNLFALDNRCAHMGGPLCEGDIEDLGKKGRPGPGELPSDGVVKCPRHGMCFNIRTGENIEGGHMKQRIYPVRLANDGRDVEVEVELEVKKIAPGDITEDETLPQASEAESTGNKPLSNPTTAGCADTDKKTCSVM